MAKMKYTPLSRENMAIADASRRTFSERLPQNKKRKDTDRDDDTAAPPAKRRSTQGMAGGRKGRKPGPAERALEEVTAMAQAQNQEEEVDEPGEIEIPDSEEEREREDEDAGPMARADRAGAPVYQYEMKETVEQDLARRIAEAESNTGAGRLTRGALKKAGNEPGNEAAGEKKTSKANGKKNSKATGKTTRGSASAGAKTAPTASTRRATKSTSRNNKGKGRKEDDILGPSTSRIEKPKIPKTFPIRRILAQRNVGGETFYTVDWYPSWVKASTVRTALIDEWNDNTAHTIQWGHDTVYKVDNPTSDTSAEHVRQLIEGVLVKYTAFMARAPEDIAAELFQHDDWEFLNDEQLSLAINAGDTAGSPHPTISAAEVLQRTFIEAHHHASGAPGSSTTHRFGHILVQYTGAIDEAAPSPTPQPSTGISAYDATAPLFAPELHDPSIMDFTTWDASNAAEIRARLIMLHDRVADLVTQSPYLLTHTWPLLFISLFFWDDEVQDLIAYSDFEVDLGGSADAGPWALRVRDVMLYTYKDECDWEMRCVDEVAESFVQAQGWIQGELDRARGAPGSDCGDDEGGVAMDGQGKGKGRADWGLSGGRTVGASSNGEGPSGTRQTRSGASRVQDGIENHRNQVVEADEEIAEEWEDVESDEAGPSSTQNNKGKGKAKASDRAITKAAGRAVTNGKGKGKGKA
ncbi:hypothetical protein EJ07DRAFT_160087 [Lizonia empirigonia]|nr:hypothetical protein EJ07DRAFT_160087 [Lizonia empirigonia]